MQSIMYATPQLGGLVGGQIAPLTNLACLSRAGFSVQVCADQGYEQLARWDETRELPVIQLPRYVNHRMHLDRTFPKSVSKWLVDEIRDFPRRMNIKSVPNADWVFAATPDDSLIQEYGFKGTKNVMMNHGCVSCYTDKLMFPWPDLAGCLVRMSRYDVLFFLTESCRQGWCEYPEISCKETHVISEAIDEPFALALKSRERSVVRKELGMPTDRFVVVCVASIQQRKGQDYLIKHAEALRACVPNLQIQFVGPYSDAWAEIQVIAPIKSDKAGTFVLVGPCTDALKYIYAADAVILPSYAEAFGMPLLEGMLLHTPVVAAAVDGMKDVLDGGRVGWLFDHADPDSLMNAFSEIASGCGVKDNLKSAEARYWNEFSWDAQAQRFKNIFVD